MISSSGRNKCGEIFIFSGKLSLICETCGDGSYTLEAFTSHILQDYVPQQLITTCIKREDASLDINTEFTPQQTYCGQRISRQSSVLHHKQNGIENTQHFTANKTKCGDIFQFMEDNFTLVCEKCSGNYSTLEAFSVHILQDHPTSASSVRIDQVEIGPEFIRLKEEHDFSDADISEPKESQYQPKIKKISKQYQCRFCDKTFPVRRHADEHENVHFERRPYECYICHKDIISFRSLRNHLRLHYDRPHKCLVCEKTFIKKSKLDLHTREKHLPATDPRRFFPCEFCDKICKTYSIMRHHVIIHHKTVKAGTFSCDYCQKSYPTRQKIVRHMSHHVVREKKQCNFCHEWLDKYNHSTHEKKHREPMMQCHLCFKSYKGTKSLRRHLKTHEKPLKKQIKKEKPLKKPIHKKKSLKKPINKEESREKPTQRTTRPHQCKICKLIVTTSSALKQHINIHTDDRQYKCVTCKEGFFRSISLRIHIRENHLPDTDPMRFFACNHCDTSFNTYSRLRYHKRLLHTKAIVYTCDYCQKAYKLRRNLVEHMTKHSSTTSKCHCCNKIFANKTDLDNHKKIKKKYYCKLCPKFYMNSSGISRHVRRTHNTYQKTLSLPKDIKFG